MTTTQWFADYANVITLTSYMADHGYDSREVAYAVEKPWKFEDVYDAALAELAEDDAQSGRQSRLNAAAKDGHDAAVAAASRTCAPTDTSAVPR